MKASIRELGTYTVAIDTIPPEIIPVNKKQWGRTGKIVYRLKDKGTGIASYRGTIDGEYALFGRPNIVKSYWECVLDPKRVKKCVCRWLDDCFLFCRLVWPVWRTLSLSCCYIS